MKGEDLLSSSNNSQCVIWHWGRYVRGEEANKIRLSVDGISACGEWSCCGLCWAVGGLCVHLTSVLGDNNLVIFQAPSFLQPLSCWIIEGTGIISFVLSLGLTIPCGGLGTMLVTFWKVIVTYYTLRQHNLQEHILWKWIVITDRNLPSSLMVGGGEISGLIYLYLLLLLSSLFLWLFTSVTTCWVPTLFLFLSLPLSSFLIVL